MGRAARRKRERREQEPEALAEGVAPSSPRPRWKLFLLPVALLAVIGWTVAANGWWEREIPVYGHRIVARLPHDDTAFTQGFLVHGGKFYESTGKYGRSSLRRIDPRTGDIEQQIPLSSKYFAEGLARVGNTLIQLTWKEGVAHYYDLETFAVQRVLAYEGEGWGLTYDGEHLVMSDGSDVLRFLDPRDLSEVRRVRVTVDGRPLDQVNELEWIDGEIWANLWKSDRVARIDPESGKVRAWVDLSGLFTERWDVDNVLNGIAWDEENRHLYVTGKRWPYVFQVEVE